MIFILLVTLDKEMPRLTDFPGFSIKTSSKFSKESVKGEFNPFDDFAPRQPLVTQKQKPLPTISEPPITQVKDPLELTPLQPTLPPEVIQVPLFPQPSPISYKDVVEKSEKEVPMFQPRSKDGQRLLYKYPDLPKIHCKGGFYYLLVGSSDKSSTAHLLQFDGAANPNPGPASSGAVLWSPKDSTGYRKVLFESGKYLGKATNNIAEVQGLLLGLQIAAMRGARELLIEGDSELIVFQQIGKYRVSDKNLKVWWAQIQAAMMDEASFDWIAIRQVPREQNERADSITKEVLSRKQGFQRA